MPNLVTLAFIVAEINVVTQTEDQKSRKKSLCYIKHPYITFTNYIYTTLLSL